MKILLMVAELFYADSQTDGQTNMAELIVAFLNFSKAPKIESILQNTVPALAGLTSES